MGLRGFILVCVPLADVGSGLSGSLLARHPLADVGTLFVSSLLACQHLAEVRCCVAVLFLPVSTLLMSARCSAVWHIARQSAVLFLPVSTLLMLACFVPFYYSYHRESCTSTCAEWWCLQHWLDCRWNLHISIVVLPVNIDWVPLNLHVQHCGPSNQRSI